MPTPDFTYDNTAPVGVTLASQTPDSTAPSGVTVSTPAHSNTAPVAFPLVVMVGTTIGPEAVPRASQVPDGTAPIDVAVSARAHDNAPPGSIARPGQTPSNAEPVAVTRADQTPSDGAPASIARPDQALTDAMPGAIPFPSTSGTDSAPQPIGYTPPLGPLSDETMHTPSLHFAGNLTLNQIFGYYVAPAVCVVKGVQLVVQKAPAGADVIVVLVDADGSSLSRTATLPAGQSTVNVNFGTPLPLLNAATVRAKVTQIGTGDTPGAYLTANLIIQLSA